MTAVVPGSGIRRYTVAGLQLLGVAALYFGAGKLGLLQQLVRGQVTPLWPPTGIALAAMLLLGPRTWPGISLGAFLINISLGPSLPAVLVIVLGNTLAPVCSYALLRRVGFHTEMDRLRDVLALVFLGALAGMLVSATIGTGTLDLAGVLSARGFWPTWSVWWTGDAMGILLIAPVLFVLSSARWPKGVSPSCWVEGAALLVCTLLVGALATNAPSLLFLVFPVLGWAALRFQLAGAAPCALIVSIFAILAAANGSGPFAGHDLLGNMITLQAFNGVVALSALLLATVVTERNATLKEITWICERLADVVAKLEPTAIGRRPPPPPPDAQHDDPEGS